jgi:uncharacterized protein (DUF4415 family)
MSKKPLTDDEGEVRPLDEDDLARFRPAKQVLTPELYEALTKRRAGQRGPGKKPVKRQITLRLEPDVIEAYKATGPRWQTLMAKAIKLQKPRADAAPDKSEEHEGQRQPPPGRISPKKRPHATLAKKSA